MNKEKEIEYFRQNILPYYIKKIEEQLEYERMLAQQEALRIKRQKELEQKKLLRLEQKCKEQEHRKAEKERLKKNAKLQKKEIIKAEKELLKQNIEKKFKIVEQNLQARLQELKTDGSEETRLASGKYKRCSRCGQVLKLEAFYKHPLRKMGVFDYCKACAKLREMQNRKNKKERLNQQKEILEKMLA